MHDRDLGKPEAAVARVVTLLDSFWDGEVSSLGEAIAEELPFELTLEAAYALACRDALGLGTPERVTLYFTESATRMSTARTDEQLDAARGDILARATGVRIRGRRR